MGSPSFPSSLTRQASLTASDHILLQVPQHPQFSPVRPAHSASPGFPFLAEPRSSFLLSCEYLVHELRCSQHLPIAEIPHSLTQDPTHWNLASLRQHLVHFFGLEAFPSPGSRLLVPRPLDPVVVERKG